MNTKLAGGWITESSENMTVGVTFVLGGAASGKSAFSENLVSQSGKRPIYIATAEVQDAEMRAKIDRHRARRGPEWTTLEAPLELAPVLATRTPEDIVLLDCATLWLTNVMLEDRDLASESSRLLAALKSAPCPVIVVSNEVGHGVVPEHKLGRDFRNAQGQLNQDLAALADRVALVVAGLPLVLKGDFPE